MLAIPHLLTGAVIGKIAEGVPYALPIAFIFGWLSHYILDSIPHWESFFPNKHDPNFETDEPIGMWPKKVLFSIFLDMVIGFSIVFKFSGFNHFWQSAIFWGAFGALSPDIVDNVPFWNKNLERTPVLRHLRAFHQSIHIGREQRNYPKYIGLLTQLLVIIIALWIL